MSEEEIPSVKDALNEYFRLKEKFENENKVNKRKIINNITLSKKEKRAEFLKLKPKCVNCKRPSKRGTIFSIIFHPSDDKNDSYRTIKASCGDLADPCNLDIQINLGNVESLDKLMINIRNEINDIKNQIINDKNKLLFGLITTETAIEEFDYNKSYISQLTSIYESYLDKWNHIVDNQTKKLELEESLVQSYMFISQIKDCIKKMNENDDSQFAVDAANIYHKTLEPLLNKIRHLKYSENIVFNDDSENVCKLIQQKYNISDILVSGYTHKVVAYDVGLKARKGKKKPLFIIESDESEDKGEKEEISIKIKDSIKSKPTKIEDEPIIGKGEDGIEWNEPEYQQLWSKLPPKLKTEFKLNIDWMKEFMNKCVNDRINPPPHYNGCKLTTPPNIVIPPREANGKYDFGVSIYNTTFNKLPKNLQSTYLTFYKTDPTTGEKNYNMLENEMNRLVEKEVDFGRGFF
jgi:hypothetical protein